MTTKVNTGNNDPSMHYRMMDPDNTPKPDDPAREADPGDIDNPIPQQVQQAQLPLFWIFNKPPEDPSKLIPPMDPS